MGKASRLKRERRNPEVLDFPATLPLSHLDRKYVVEKTGARPKISEALVALIEPLKTEDTNLAFYRVLIGIAALVWNLSLQEDPDVEEVVDICENVEGADREWFKALVADLVLRKRILFPNDHRVVVGWEVSLLPNGDFYVTAATARIG